MRRLAAALIALSLVGALSCGGGASPSPIKATPGVTTPASPKASPGGDYDYGY